MTTKKISASERARHLDAAREIVREGRRRLGLTQAQMGSLVERSQGEISRIEAGRVEPSIWVVMYLLHNYPDLLSSTTTDAEQLKAAVRQRIETMDEAALRAVLVFSRT